MLRFFEPRASNSFLVGVLFLVSFLLIYILLVYHSATINQIFGIFDQCHSCFLGIAKKVQANSRLEDYVLKTFLLILFIILGIVAYILGEFLLLLSQFIMEDLFSSMFGKDIAVYACKLADLSLSKKEYRNIVVEYINPYSRNSNFANISNNYDSWGLTVQDILNLGKEYWLRKGEVFLQKSQFLFTILLSFNIATLLAFSFAAYSIKETKSNLEMIVSLLSLINFIVILFSNRLKNFIISFPIFAISLALESYFLLKLGLSNSVIAGLYFFLLITFVVMHVYIPIYRMRGNAYFKLASLASMEERKNKD